MGFVAAFLLSGCDVNIERDQMALRDNGGVPQLTVCRDGEIQGGLASKDDEDFWLASGSLMVGPDETIDFDQSSEDWVVRTFDVSALDANSSIDIILDSDPDLRSYFAHFDIPPAGLPDRMWLRSDGTVTDDPC